MNWYREVDEIAQSLAQFLANNPELEFEVEKEVSVLPRGLQGIIKRKVHEYIKQYLEQGGGDVQVFV